MVRQYLPHGHLYVPTPIWQVECAVPDSMDLQRLHASLFSRLGSMRLRAKLSGPHCWPRHCRYWILRPSSQRLFSYSLHCPSLETPHSSQLNLDRPFTGCDLQSLDRWSTYPTGLVVLEL